MKKLLMLLLIATLAVFVLAGCDGFTPAESEGEGEDEDEGVEISVEIEGLIVINDKPYITTGTHNITVTFPIRLKDAYVIITECKGDYSQDRDDANKVILLPPENWDPNVGATVWTGTGYFGNGESDCCACYVEIYSDTYSEDCLMVMPIIVSADSNLPC